MIKSTAMLLDELKDYQDPFGKINRMVSSGKLYKVTKAVYETDGNVPGYLLAPFIYGPSYLSLEYALSRYGLIPEAVHEYTCVTCAKGKKKLYHNDFGDFSFRDIPEAAFPYETKMISELGYTYTIAGPEKALCDKLYALPPVCNQSEMKELIFENLRIDEYELSKLDANVIDNLSELYRSNNIRFLSKIMERGF